MIHWNKNIVINKTENNALPPCIYFGRRPRRSCAPAICYWLFLPLELSRWRKTSDSSNRTKDGFTDRCVTADFDCLYSVSYAELSFTTFGQNDAIYQIRVIGK